MRTTYGGAVIAALACSASPTPEREASAPRDMTGTASDSLDLRLTAPSEASEGEVVPITITLTNRSDRRVTLYLRGREIVFDIHVTDAMGDTVWQRLYDQIIPAIVQVKELAAGESLELRDTWDQRINTGAAAPPGQYTVVGSIFRDEPEPMRTPPASLRIEPSPRRDRN